MERALGRMLVIAGLAIAGLGLLLLALPRVPWLGRLPGDLRVSRDGFSFFLPLATCLLVSLLLTLLLNLFAKR